MGFVCMLFIDNFNFKKGISKIGDKFFFFNKKVSESAAKHTTGSTENLD